MSIRRKILLLLLAVFIPTLLFQCLMIRDRYGELLERELQANLEMSRAMGEAFNTYVRDIYHHELAVGIAFTSPTPLPDVLLDRLLKETEVEHPALDRISWVDPRGFIVASSQSGAVGVYVGDRAYFQEIVSGKEWVVSEVLVSRIMGRPGFAVCRGFRDEAGNLLGVALATVNPERLDGALSIERAGAGAISIVDNKGILVCRLPKVEYTGEGRNWLAYPHIKGALEGRETASIVTSMRDGTERLVAAAPIRSIGWAAGASRPVEEVKAPIVSSLVTRVGLFFSAVLIAVLIALPLSRTITRPVGKLREAALAVGRGERAEPIEASGPAELKDLALAFNRMADDIRERERRLRQQAVIVEQVHDSVISTDLHGVVTSWNNGSQRLFGYTAEEAIGRHVSFLYPEEDHEFLETGIVEPLLRKGGLELEARKLRKSGELLDVHLSLSLLKDEAGNTVGLIGYSMDITARKRAEDALRQSMDQLDARVRERTRELVQANEDLQRSKEALGRERERLRGILNAMEDSVFIINAGFGIEYLNPVAEREFGAVGGRKCHDYFFGRTDVCRDCRIENVLDGGSARWIRECPGSDVTYDVFDTPVEGPDGNLANLKILHDITRHRRLQAALAESEKKYRTLVETMNEGLVVVDEEGAITYVNDKYCEINGFSREELLGQPLTIRAHESERHKLEEQIAQRKHGVRSVYEIRSIAKDGRELHTVISAAPVFDENGNFKGSFGTVSDITERKLAERALARAVRALRALSECNSALVHEKEEHELLGRVCGIIVEVGGYRMAWIGYAEPDGRKSVRPVAQAGREDGYLTAVDISWADVENGRGPVGLAIREARPRIGRDFESDPRLAPWRTEALKRGYASCIALPLRSNEGAFGALTIYAVEPDAFDDDEVKLLTDLADNLAYGISSIRARREGERAEKNLAIYMEKLEQSNRELDSFASIASHDLQEPLRKIKYFTEMIMDDYSGALDAQGLDFLNRMHNAAERMQALIESLLNYSRVTSRAEPFVPVDLNALVEDVLADLEFRIESSGGRVDVGPLPAIHADATQVRQLFQNLIANALKFHRPGASPVVEVRGAPCEPGFCRIVVQDNGIGFDNRHAERIFGAFERLHGRQSGYEGTGMGLAICRKIVERHGGSITAAGAPGEGSTFTVMLPLKQARPETA